jgi:hypothetical protein
MRDEIEGRRPMKELGHQEFHRHKPEPSPDGEHKEHQQAIKCEYRAKGDERREAPQPNDQPQRNEPARDRPLRAVASIGVSVLYLVGNAHLPEEHECDDECRRVGRGTRDDPACEMRRGGDGRRREGEQQRNDPLERKPLCLVDP